MERRNGVWVAVRRGRELIVLVRSFVLLLLCGCA